MGNTHNTTRDEKRLSVHELKAKYGITKDIMKRVEISLTLSCIPVVIVLGGLLYDDGLQITGFLEMARAFNQLKVNLIFKPRITAAEAVALMIALADMIDQGQKNVPVIIFYYGHGNGISINLSPDDSVEIQDLLCPWGASEHLKKIDKTILLECCRVCDDGTILNHPSIDGFCDYLGSVLLAYSTLHGKPAVGPIWGTSLANNFSQSLQVIQAVRSANMDMKEKTEQMPILYCTTAGSTYLKSSVGVYPCDCKKCSVYELCVDGCQRPDWSSQLSYPIIRENGERHEQAVDVGLSSSTDQIAKEFYILTYAIVSSFRARMGRDIDKYAFKADAENYLHCTVQEVCAIYEHIRCLCWYDVGNVAIQRLIEKFGSNSDRQRLRRFEEHRDEYFISQNRLCMVPKSHELYCQLSPNPEATVYLFHVDSRWSQIHYKWLPGIHRHITRLIVKQFDISLCYVYFCTDAKAS